jgi:hypothetical protein
LHSVAPAHSIINAGAQLARCCEPVVPVTTRPLAAATADDAVGCQCFPWYTAAALGTLLLMQPTLPPLNPAAPALLLTAISFFPLLRPCIMMELVSLHITAAGLLPKKQLK